jgi:uncharacterized protein (DUF1015 family)
MAEILPIRPWRYRPELAANLDELTSPLFDVVSDKQRNALYQNPYNSIHLSVPQPPDAANKAAHILKTWKENGVILQDSLPGIYVYYQYFTLPGHTKTFCRKGFICHIRVYDWEERVILRHENTIPNAVNDRVELLEKTGLHSSPTHGLYADPAFELERYMDESIKAPLLETEDYQGVRDVLSVIQDSAIIRKFLSFIRDKKIILADGHHRYEGSLIYKKKQLKRYPNALSAGFNFHLMYLTNTESDDLRILPTHRLIKNMRPFDEHDILKKMQEDFNIKPIDDSDTLNEIIAGKPWTFGLLFRENSYKIKLKPESLSGIPWPFPEVVKKLDLTVMHYFIIEKVLGIPGKAQRRSENVEFDRSYSDCLKKVIKGEVQMAIITNEVSIEAVKTVCESGYTMPQKSTYFYPKAICGFLFTSILEEEFQEQVYSPFYNEA